MQTAAVKNTSAAECHSNPFIWNVSSWDIRAHTSASLTFVIIFHKHTILRSYSCWDIAMASIRCGQRNPNPIVNQDQFLSNCNLNLISIHILLFTLAWWHSRPSPFLHVVYIVETYIMDAGTEISCYISMQILIFTFKSIHYRNDLNPVGMWTGYLQASARWSHTLPSVCSKTTTEQ